jgi:hypothetical protein
MIGPMRDGHVSKAIGWFKSSRSQGSENCVEVQFAGDRVLIRDSKYLRNPSNEPTAQPIITVPAADWQTFLDAAALTEPRTVFPVIAPEPDGYVTIHDARGTALTYTPDEWEAFKVGAATGEFAIERAVAAA